MKVHKPAVNLKYIRSPKRKSQKALKSPRALTVNMSLLTTGSPLHRQYEAEALDVVQAAPDCITERGEGQ